MKKSTKNKIILISVVAIILLIYFFVPSVNKAISTAVKTLMNADIEGVATYIRNFGGWAYAVSFLLMILQSIISPIPAFFITLANSLIWGWVIGSILSWCSAMVGAAVCFYIARILGRDIVIKLNSISAIETAERFFKKYGSRAILVARLLPFMSFDLVSYFAGLTSIGFWEFFIATGIGQLPATIVYSYVGGKLSGGAQKLMTGLLLLFALFFIGGIVKKIYNDRQKSEEDKIQ